MLSNADIERARKEARRRELNRQLTRVNGQIYSVEQLITNFQNQKNAMQDFSDEWTRAKERAMASEIVQSIKVSKVFEGDIADKYSTELPEKIRNMDSNNIKARSVITMTQSQITKLNTHKSTLESRKRGIVSELNSL